MDEMYAQGLRSTMQPRSSAQARPAMSRRLILPAILALGLGACATVPQQLTGTYTTVTADNAAAVAPGTRVRWGGRIIQTEPKEQETCFFVLDEPLDSQARPEQGEQSRGRF